MPDTWLIVKASFPNLEARSIIRNFVEPIVDKFQNSLSTFHFFFEPHLLLRIKAEDALIIQEIKPYIETTLKDLNATNPSASVDASYSEESDYGDGWEIAQEIFESGSRSAILKAESDVGNVKLGLQFNEGKFMHLLLNQWGHSIRQEALIHFKIVGERLAILYSGGNTNLVERTLPQILTQLQVTFFPQVDELVKRKMTQPQ